MRGTRSSCGRKSSNQRCYFMIMAQLQIATFHFALRAKHESRPCRKTVFDGLQACLVGGLVNKFPIRHKCTASRFAPFVGPDTKSLTASRKRPLRGLHEKSGCRRGNCDPLILCQFVSGNVRFVSVEAEAPMGRGNGASLRGGGPCRTAAQPPSDNDGFRVSRKAQCR